MSDVPKNDDAGKWTPGPWTVGPCNMNDEATVESEHLLVCTCHHHCVGAIEKEMWANARLIAAAPDMAEALVYARRKLANCATAHGNDAETIAALCEPIDEALAKARGHE